MARQRMIQPGIKDSDTLASISRDARLAFVYLLTEANDAGKFLVRLSSLCERLFPLDDDVTIEVLGGWLCDLEAIGCITFHTDKGKIYGHIVNFNKYQTINRPSKDLLPSLTQANLINYAQHRHSVSGSVSVSMRESVSCSHTHSRRKKEGRKEGTISSSIVESSGGSGCGKPDEPLHNTARTNEPTPLGNFLGLFARSQSESRISE